jgi:hypothetical protein
MEVAPLSRVTDFRGFELVIYPLNESDHAKRIIVGSS